MNVENRKEEKSIDSLHSSHSSISDRSVSLEQIEFGEYIYKYVCLYLSHEIEKSKIGCF